MDIGPKTARKKPCGRYNGHFCHQNGNVTIVALQGVTDGMNEKERQSQIDKNIMSIRANVKKEKSKTYRPALL